MEQIRLSELCWGAWTARRGWRNSLRLSLPGSGSGWLGGEGEDREESGRTRVQLG